MWYSFTPTEIGDAPNDRFKLTILFQICMHAVQCCGPRVQYLSLLLLAFSQKIMWDSPT